MRIFRNKQNKKQIFKLSESEDENKIRTFEENQDFEELIELEGK